MVVPLPQSKPSSRDRDSRNANAAQFFTDLQSELSAPDPRTPVAAPRSSLRRGSRPIAKLYNELTPLEQADRDRQGIQSLKGFAVGLPAGLLGLPADLAALIFRDAPQLAAKLVTGQELKVEERTFIDKLVGDFQRAAGAEAIMGYMGFGDDLLPEEDEKGQPVSLATDAMSQAGLTPFRAGSLIGEVTAPIPTGAGIARLLGRRSKAAGEVLPPERVEPTISTTSDELGDIIEGSVVEPLPAPRAADSVEELANAEELNQAALTQAAEDMNAGVIRQDTTEGPAVIDPVEAPQTNAAVEANDRRLFHTGQLFDDEFETYISINRDRITENELIVSDTRVELDNLRTRGRENLNDVERQRLDELTESVTEAERDIGVSRQRILDAEETMARRAEGTEVRLDDAQQEEVANQLFAPRSRATQEVPTNAAEELAGVRVEDDVIEGTAVEVPSREVPTAEGAGIETVLPASFRDIPKSEPSVAREGQRVFIGGKSGVKIGDVDPATGHRLIGYSPTRNMIEYAAEGGVALKGGNRLKGKTWLQTLNKSFAQSELKNTRFLRTLEKNPEQEFTVDEIRDLADSTIPQASSRMNTVSELLDPDNTNPLAGTRQRLLGTQRGTSITYVGKIDRNSGVYEPASIQLPRYLEDTAVDGFVVTVKHDNNRINIPGFGDTQVSPNINNVTGGHTYYGHSIPGYYGHARGQIVDLIPEGAAPGQTEKTGVAFEMQSDGVGDIDSGSKYDITEMALAKQNNDTAKVDQLRAERAAQGLVGDGSDYLYANTLESRLNAITKKTSTGGPFMSRNSISPKPYADTVRVPFTDEVQDLMELGESLRPKLLADRTQKLETIRTLREQERGITSKFEYKYFSPTSLNSLDSQIKYATELAAAETIADVSNAAEVRTIVEQLRVITGGDPAMSNLSLLRELNENDAAIIAAENMLMRSGLNTTPDNVKEVLDQIGSFGDVRRDISPSYLQKDNVNNPAFRDLFSAEERANESYLITSGVAELRADEAIKDGFSLNADILNRLTNYVRTRALNRNESLNSVYLDKIIMKELIETPTIKKYFKDLDEADGVTWLKESNYNARASIAKEVFDSMPKKERKKIREAMDSFVEKTQAESPNSVISPISGAHKYDSSRPLGERQLPASVYVGEGDFLNAYDSKIKGDITTLFTKDNVGGYYDNLEVSNLRKKIEAKEGELPDDDAIAAALEDEKLTLAALGDGKGRKILQLREVAEMTLANPERGFLPIPPQSKSSDFVKSMVRTLLREAKLNGQKNFIFPSWEDIASTRTTDETKVAVYKETFGRQVDAALKEIKRENPELEIVNMQDIPVIARDGTRQVMTGLGEFRVVKLGEPSGEVFNNPIRRATGGMVRSGIGAMAREVM